MGEWESGKDHPELKPRQAIKESDYLLVCNSLGIINIAVYRTHDERIMTINDGWYDKSNHRLNDIIAWMELPKPPGRSNDGTDDHMELSQGR